MSLNSLTQARKKVAVTSQNFRTVTGHAGKSRRFLIYSKTDADQWEEVERFDFPKEMSMHEFRGDKHPLDDLDVIITGSCGAGFVRRMQSRGVEVYATSETDPVKAVLSIANGDELPPPVAHSH